MNLFNKLFGHGLIVLTSMAAVPHSTAKGDGVANWVGESFAGAPCRGSEPGNFGPYDYLVRGDMGVVHKAHFTPRVQFLQGGENAAGPTSDLDYVLKVIPNHHKALNSALTFHYRAERGAYSIENDKGMTGYRLRSPIECYLQRAIDFRPHDAISRMLFASLLHKTDQFNRAKREYEIALEDDPHSVDLRYNYALLLADMRKWEESRTIAIELYSRGFPLPGLKNKLIRAGQWRE